jgi:hypothetical protein
MKLFEWILIGLVIFFIVGAGLVVANSYFNKDNEEEELVQSDLDVDVLFLKIAMAVEEEARQTIRIRNLASERRDFSLSLDGSEDIASIFENHFSLGAGEEKELLVFFDSKDKDPGVYLSNLEVSSLYDTRLVPVVAEIQTTAVLFDSNINLFPAGRDIAVSQRITSEIVVFDLAGIGKRGVRLKYYIKDFTGRTIISEEEDIIVEGRLGYSKTLDFPTNMELGDYVFVSTVEYQGSVGTSSVSFRIVEEPVELYSFSGLFFVVALFVLFFLDNSLILNFSECCLVTCIFRDF